MTDPAPPCACPPGYEDGGCVFLEKWQSIASAYIGIARLHLENGEPDSAKTALDTCCDKLDELLPAEVRDMLRRQNDHP